MVYLGPSTTKEDSVVRDGLAQEMALVNNTGSGFRLPSILPLVMVALGLVTQSLYVSLFSAVKCGCQQ